jgi:hypothetical protein
VNSEECNFSLKKHSKKHEKIACAEPAVKHQIFMGPMSQTTAAKDNQTLCN